MALSEWEEATLEELKFANAAGSPSASPAWAALPELVLFCFWRHQEGTDHSGQSIQAGK